MSTPRETPDDECVAALLDGRVHGEGRQRLLAHLADAGDDYAVFADAASVVRALEEEDAEGQATNRVSAHGRVTD